MKIYDEADYANSRLRETVVRLKSTGEPIMVMQVLSRDEVTYYRLGNDQHEVCKLSDLNIDPVPLGYCNYGAKCDYLVRMPMRQDWKQGLRYNSLRNIAGVKVNVTWDNVKSTILGKFPSFEKAIEMVSTSVSKNPFNRNLDRPERVAFHRDFALNNTGKLQWKGKVKFGEYKPDGSVFIYDKYEWVEDSFKLAKAA